MSPRPRPLSYKGLRNQGVRVAGVILSFRSLSSCVFVSPLVRGGQGRGGWVAAQAVCTGCYVRTLRP